MRRRNLLGGLAGGAAAIGLSACGGSSLTERGGGETRQFDGLPVLGKAPEISSATWINSEPLTMAGFRGKSAVGIGFWTYG